MIEKEIFTLALWSDIDGAIALIRRRMEWLRGRGIEQWDEAEYFKEYPRAYFERCVVESRLFAMKRGMELCGCVVLSESDPVWNDGAEAIYIHNLVASPEWPGTGRRIMMLAECHALSLGKKLSRLDCQADNRALNDFYLALGYHHVGRFINGHYEGSKMEKLLSPP
jgi:GNAT superfamily N-acetyltransferase